MKLHYYPETDSLYIELKNEPSAETHEVASNVNVDLDANGDVVGFDIDHASERLDLSKLETEELPVRATKSSRDRESDSTSRRSTGSTTDTNAKIG